MPSDVVDPMLGITVVHPPKETKMAAKKKTAAKSSSKKIPKAFSGSASSRNDYLAGESVYPTRKKKSAGSGKK